MLCNIPEECRSHQHCGQSLKSMRVHFVRKMPEEVSLQYNRNAVICGFDWTRDSEMESAKRFVIEIRFIHWGFPLWCNPFTLSHQCIIPCYVRIYRSHHFT
jgi:hypothetical protein